MTAESPSTLSLDHIFLTEQLRKTRGLDPLSAEELDKLSKDKAYYRASPFIKFLRQLLSCSSEMDLDIEDDELQALAAAMGGQMRVHSLKNPFAFGVPTFDAVVISVSGAPIAFRDSEEADYDPDAIDFTFIEPLACEFALRSIVNLRHQKQLDAISRRMSFRTKPCRIQQVFGGDDIAIVEVPAQGGLSDIRVRCVRPAEAPDYEKSFKPSFRNAIATLEDGTAVTFDSWACAERVLPLANFKTAEGQCIQADARTVRFSLAP